jgi:predicted short-subunit dehydrogenase-like oxidoreductase (DUF2520 family)
VGREAARLGPLADEFQTAVATNLKQVDTTADLYLLAIPDDAIAAVAHRLSTVLPDTAFVVHTSGATPTAAVANSFTRAGVFYPLQSFNRSQPVDWTQVPLLYHATGPVDLAACAELAAALSSLVSPADDAQRATLHLAAVFANNFTNYLYTIAHRLTTDAEIDFALLLPLIRHTAQRLDGDTTPRHWQTGPAVRHDRATLQRHLAALASHPEYAKLYAELTRLIQEEE